MSKSDNFWSTNNFCEKSLNGLLFHVQDFDIESDESAHLALNCMHT